MTTYGSYSDFTTRGSGVIEGLGGGRRGKIGPVYRKASHIPETHELAKTVDKIIKVSKHLESLPSDREQQINHDLELGYTIRIRDDLYIKRQPNGDIAVYQNKSVAQKIKSNPARKMTLTKSEQKALHKKREDEAYAHLLDVYNRANRK